MDPDGHRSPGCSCWIRSGAKQAINAYRFFVTLLVYKALHEQEPQYRYRGYRFFVTLLVDYRFLVTDYRFLVTNYRFLVTDYRFLVTGGFLNPLIYKALKPAKKTESYIRL